MTRPDLLASRTRRPHRKAKTGCLECRRWRINCGEEKPSCKACVRQRDEESTALFACAILNVIYLLVTFGPLLRDSADGRTATDHKSHILGAEWIPMLRGVGFVLQLGYDGVRSGPLSNMLDLGKLGRAETRQRTDRRR
ncbi:hypothetical protein B0H67DRAFT_582283 [Lasiosphaeris hirsuta]|uniref:Zn(2)-C6 fungal-type domain-containing protein n=1 Tax=Lasiosphaeris hirsuta TaxID=260670 RepID=A0AA40AHP6_9PEZI|nr:hypothetical protein B0H67DRAFT_582283 [Lasiosphaeris hirsuta]